MMQTHSTSTDEDIGVGRRRMRTPERGGNGRTVWLHPFDTRPPSPFPRGAAAFDEAAAIMTTAPIASLVHHMARAKGACLGANRTASTCAASQSMDDPGSAAQVPTDDVHRPEHVEACYQATRARIAALEKRRHRGRSRRSRDESDGRAALFSSGAGAGCEFDPHAGPSA